MHSTLIFITFAIRLSFVVQTQTVNIECEFVVSGSDYVCQLNSIEVVDVENQEIFIGGRHSQGRDDDDVTMVMLFDSTIPFIMTQVFRTFRRLENLIVHDSGLRRIQHDALTNAGNLQRLTITSNPQLKTIPANTFHGAPELTHLILAGNQIESVSLVAFNGLTKLRFLFLSQNLICFLSLNTFRQLPSLQHLVISHNFIDSIDSRLFSNNNQLVRLDISANRIDGIEENVLDRLIKLRSFDARGNKCVNRSWNIEGENDKVQNDLRICFDNFIGPPEARTFIMEIRGKLTIRDENGVEIVKF